jgi:glycosyltransferase involved in cell wall biosynthesis
MVVLNTLDPDPRVWKEGRSLAAAGYSVTILALRGKGQALLNEDDGMTVLRMFATSPYGLKPWNVVRVWTRFLWFLLNPRRERFAACHCHDADALPMGWMMAVKDKAHLIYDAHELIFSYVPIPCGFHPVRKVLLLAYRSFLRIVERRLIGNAQAVITVNVSLARILKRYYHLTKMPLAIYNSRRLTHVPLTDFIRNKTRISKEKVILFYQGAIREDREIERIIHLLPRLDERAVFVIAGPTNPPGYFESLESLAASLGVANRFFNLGYLDYDEELLEATASADVGVFLLPGNNLTYRYSLANKIFDYVMAGLPIVASDLPEMKNLIRRHHLGFTVALNDTDGVLKILQRLTKDQTLRQALRSKVIQVRDELCWERDEERLLDLYHSLIGISPGGSLKSLA